MTDRVQRIERLINAARQADKGALDDLLGLFRNYLYVLTRSRKNKLLDAKLDDSDVVQETLVKAHFRFEQFRGQSEAELAAWLRKMLTRHLIDCVRHYRSQGRDAERERSLDAMVEASSQAFQNFLAASGATPSQQVHGREMAVVLSDALESLQPDSRDVVICKNIKDLTWEETAEEMNRTVSAVRILWTKALKELRPLLEGKI